MRHRLALAPGLRIAIPISLTFLLASASTALAQTPSAPAGAQSDTYIERQIDSGSSIIFKEDLTTGSTLGGTGARIIVPGGAFRMGLVRPRLNFVSEMLKSVEAL